MDNKLSFHLIFCRVMDDYCLMMNQLYISEAKDIYYSLLFLIDL
jgi:hypothetical protein